MAISLPHLTSWNSNWAEIHVLVTGLGVAGFACADTLIELGAKVTVFDVSETEHTKHRAETIKILGGIFTSDQALVESYVQQKVFDLVVTSPGWSPEHEIFVHARRSGIPLWGDVELAWRLRQRHGKKTAQWLLVTGTNGKTTTVTMLESILLHASLRARAVGNIGVSILDALREPVEYDVLAVELSSFQLYWMESVSAESAVVLNFAPDHLDWHGNEQAYYDAKAKVFHQVKIACIYNHEDPRTQQMVEEADVVEGARAIGLTLGIPSVSMFGVVDQFLCDRAFTSKRSTYALEVCEIADLPAPVAAHTLMNALAAAALARSIGVAPEAVSQGLHAYKTPKHRLEKIMQHRDVEWINDSKATNPHAAEAALTAFDSIIWIIGGLSKGASYNRLIRKYYNKLKAVIILGKDQTPFVRALKEINATIPVYLTQAVAGEQAMAEAVKAADTYAKPGDVVLLAPAAASMDQFDSYSHRGSCFIEEVRKIEGEHG